MVNIHDKFEEDNNVYFSYLDSIQKQPPNSVDIIHHFPSYVGSVNLSRFLSLYEIYSLTKNLSGDLLDIGTWKGYSFFSFAKFVKIFEPYSNTTVHCMDWFSGMNPESKNNKYADCTENEIIELINLQNLNGIAYAHNLDLKNDLPKFCEERPWQRFKLIFIDCGDEKVIENVFKNLWDRLIPGGIMIFDHFNNSCSPSESNIIQKYCKDRKVNQVSFSRSPTGYIIK